MSSEQMKEIMDAIMCLSRDEMIEVYQFLGERLGRSTEVPKPIKQEPIFQEPEEPRRVTMDYIPLPRETDDSRMTDCHYVSDGDSDEDDSDEDDSDEDDSDEDDSASPMRRCPAPDKSKNLLSRVSEDPKRRKKSSPSDPESSDFDASTTTFNPDAAKNILQQYHQSFINPATTPVYTAATYPGSAEVRFWIEAGGPEKRITGFGRNKAESEKNAALRACVFLEQNVPGFKTLRLPGNARIERNSEGSALGASRGGAESEYGLTPLNAANFLFHCNWDMRNNSKILFLN